MIYIVILFSPIAVVLVQYVMSTEKRKMVKQLKSLTWEISTSDVQAYSGEHLIKISDYPWKVCIDDIEQDDQKFITAAIETTYHIYKLKRKEERMKKNKSNAKKREHIKRVLGLIQ